MKFTRIITAILVYSVCLCSYGQGVSQASPQKLIIPKMSTPPVIDGKINQDEWKEASSITGFMNFTGKLLLPHDLQPVWWIAYDDTNLYIAQKYPLYPKGSIKASVKQGDRGGIAQDTDTILWDDHVEIQISDLKERSMPNKSYFYKILINPYSAVFDHRIEWSVGWWGYEWESETKVKSTIDDDYWTFEMSVPFRTLGHKNAPEDGTKWFMQLVSAGDPGSYYFAWQPVSWLDWDYFPEVVFDSTAPAMQLMSLGEPMNGKLDLNVGLYAKKAEAVSISVSVLDGQGKSIFEETRKCETKPGEQSVFNFKKELAITDIPDFQWAKNMNLAPGYNLMKFKAETASGKVLYESQMPFVKTPATLKTFLYDMIANSRGNAGSPKLNSIYYHSAQKLEASVDVDIIRIKPELRQCQDFRSRIIAKKDGKAVVEHAGFILPNGQGTLIGSVPALEDGDYEVITEVLAKDGKVLASKTELFSVRKYPWEQTQAGREKIVVKPFTPVEVSGKTLKVWGRTYTFGDNGLPSSLTSLGKEILSGPVSFEAEINGKKEEFTPTSWPAWTEIAGHNSTIQTTGKCGPVKFKIAADTEYDGTTFYTVDISPVASARIDKLDLVIPVTGLDGYLAYRSGRDMIVGQIPSADGVFWDSSKLSPAPNFLGTFLPVAMLTDGERGFVWCADSDQGWLLDDSKASFFLEKSGDKTIIRARICNTSRFLRETRRIKFSFHVLPSKMLPEDYRYRGWERMGNAPTMGALSCFWAYGTGPCVSFYKPEHYKVFKEVIDKEKMEARNAQVKLNGPKYEPLDRWYVATNTTGLAMPEYDTYSGEWIGTTWKKPEPESHYKDAKTPWGIWTEPRQQCRAYMDLLPASVDCRVYAFDQHQKQCGLNGYWWDHDRFWASGSVVKGTAYVRDDGKVQGIFNISLMREMMKRMTTCAEINGVRPWHGYYAPNNIGPISAFMQYNWAVEGWVYLTSSKNDMMDNVQNLSKFKIFSGRYTGNPTILSTSTWESYGEGCDLERYPFQSRSVHGMSLLADIGISEGRTRPDEYTRLYKCLEDFGYFNTQTEWIPFWRSADFAKISSGKGVCTVYKRNIPGVTPAAVLVVFNDSDNDTVVNIKTDDMKLLGKPASKLTDIELAARKADKKEYKEDADLAVEVKRSGDDWKDIKVKRHDYRLLVLE